MSGLNRKDFLKWLLNLSIKVKNLYYVKSLDEANDYIWDKSRKLYLVLTETTTAQLHTDKVINFLWRDELVGRLLLVEYRGRHTDIKFGFGNITIHTFNDRKHLYNIKCSESDYGSGWKLYINL